MDMGGMDHGGDDAMAGASCKISMLWNWYTIDACFLTNDWHVRTKAQFAGTCIGIILMAMGFEFLRRAQREFEVYVRVQTAKQAAAERSPLVKTTSPGSIAKGDEEAASQRGNAVARKPAFVYHVIKAALHTASFIVAYIMMLLGMYFNGYILFSLFIGIMLGQLVFNWTPIETHSRHEADTVSGCCG